MYIVLDANIFTADKRFRSSFWRLIGTRPKKWGLHVAVPWPVVQEAIANRRRDLEEALAGLHKALDGVARQGVPASALETIQALQHEIDGYRDWFEEKLNSLRIEVLPAHFDHFETVHRAVNRLPPCNTKGDGYRDTLNWLTVLRLVEQNQDQDAVWVSNDSGFFAETDPLRLHGNLIEDLTALGAEARVSCRRDLAQAQNLLIERHQLDAETWGWSTLQERVAEMVVADLNTTDFLLDPVDCGLPLYTKIAYASLESATETDPATVTDLEADTPGQDRVLPFEVHFDATIGLAHDGSQEIVTKQLVASGTIRINGQTHEVTDLMVDDVSGVADDPDVLRNQALVQRAERVQRILQSSDLTGPDTVTLATVVGLQPSFAKVLAEQLETQTQDVTATLAEVLGSQPQRSFADVIAEQLETQTQDVTATLAKALGSQPQRSFADVIAEQLETQTQDVTATLAKVLGSQPQPSFADVIAEQLEKLGLVEPVHKGEPTNDPAGEPEGPADTATSDDEGPTGANSADDQDV